MKISSFQEYKEHYKNSVERPEAFWSDIAKNFKWNKKWDTVLNYDFDKGEIKWFEGGQLNITENCLDRHIQENGLRTAIIWEPNDPKEDAIHISYQELFAQVSQFANVLKNNNVKKGDRVCIYMPMIPELAVAVLACARIGAIHSVVFAGFSSTALSSRINDAECKALITADGGFRGSKITPLKEIADKAMLSCPSIEACIVVQRTNSKVEMKAGRDKWWHEELKNANIYCAPEVMDAEDPLFILYTSGSTGKPKGMVHSTGGYMVYTAYTFLNVFQYTPGDVYWCTADIGWVTGHSYILYGPLACGATTVMFEGVPTYPDAGRFWEVVAKHEVNQFYTAPTAIRALEKFDVSLVNKHDLSSLKVLGSVGEPINAEAWHWYDDNVGKGKCPIVDTWWQTETGGILISSLAGETPQKPTFATLPMPGVQPALMDETGKVITETKAEGRLAIKFPWPGIARTIYGNHDRYIKTYFSSFPGMYFSGDGALRDADGNYRITGRVDDVVIVSGHNLGTAPIENIIDEHTATVESAIVGFPHDVKGSALYGFVILHDNQTGDDELRKQINGLISDNIGPIAKLDKIQFVNGLPKTRSGKIMRRVLRKIASGEHDQLGDISTLLNPEVVQSIIDERLV